LPSFKIKISFIISFLIYLAMLSFIFVESRPLLGILLLAFTLLISGWYTPERLILFPFYLYPFMFLIRAQSPENILLIILPDIVTCSVIFLHFMTQKISTKNLSLLFLLFILSFIVFLINVYHTGFLSYSFVIFRQYVLPLIFLFVFINSASRSINIHEDALFISIQCFSITALLAILNTMGVIFIPRSIEALFPVLGFLDDGNDINTLGRTFFGMFMPRLNLYLGGALGSAAAISFILGIVALFHVKNKIWWFPKLLALPLLLAALATLSMSIIFAFVGYYFAFYICRKQNIQKNFLKYVLLIVICLLLFTVSFIEISAASYFVDFIFYELIHYLSKLDFLEIFFGVGPRITSSGFYFLPEKFIIDVGIFRVFVESGIFAFIVFLVILVYFFLRGYRASRYKDITEVRPYLAIFIVFMLSVHANMALLPPFYPLFCAVCLGMLSRAEQKKPRQSSFK
jgi:hypothetical protein